jgi:chorismate mutase
VSGSREESGETPDKRGAQDRLEELRRRIIALDEELIRLVGQRRDLVIEVGKTKAELGVPVLDPAQEARVVRRAAEQARTLGVDEELARDVIWRIIAAARQEQEKRSSWGPPDAHPPESGAPNES